MNRLTSSVESIEGSVGASEQRTARSLTVRLASIGTIDCQSGDSWWSVRGNATSGSLDAATALKGIISMG